MTFATVALVPWYRTASFSVPYQRNHAIGTIVTVPRVPKRGMEIASLMLQGGWGSNSEDTLTITK
jgi:hypothetical protein